MGGFSWKKVMELVLSGSNPFLQVTAWERSAINTFAMELILGLKEKAHSILARGTSEAGVGQSHPLRKEADG